MYASTILTKSACILATHSLVGCPQLIANLSNEYYMLLNIVLRLCPHQYHWLLSLSTCVTFVTLNRLLLFHIMVLCLHTYSLMDLHCLVTHISYIYSLLWFCFLINQSMYLQNTIYSFIILRNVFPWGSFPLHPHLLGFIA